MKRRLTLAALATLTLAAGMTAATLAKPVTYTQPTDTSTLKQTRDQGYAKAEALCATCHSRDYITTQPPGKGKEFWAAEVTKMVVVYGAPIPEPDRPTLVEYLAATY
jgi:mono/diheme cytochrome c family protein